MHHISRPVLFNGGQETHDVVIPVAPRRQSVFIWGYERCHADETAPADVVTTTIELSWPFVFLTCGSSHLTTSKNISLSERRLDEAI